MKFALGRNVNEPSWVAPISVLTAARVPFTKSVPFAGSEVTRTAWRVPADANAAANGAEENVNVASSPSACVVAPETGAVVTPSPLRVAPVWA